MKTCFKCKESKNFEEFSNNKSKKDGKNPCCRPCQKNYMAKHYIENKEYYFKNSKLQKQKIKDTINEIKNSSQCIVCGEDHPATLDFHHFEDNKEFCIGEGIRHGFEKTKSEIKKCVILCSNCHRKKHWDERQELKSINNKSV